MKGRSPETVKRPESPGHDGRSGPNDSALMATSRPWFWRRKCLLMCVRLREGGRLKGKGWRADPGWRAALNFTLKRSIRDDVWKHSRSVVTPESKLEKAQTLQWFQNKLQPRRFQMSRGVPPRQIKVKLYATFPLVWCRITLNWTRWQFMDFHWMQTTSFDDNAWWIFFRSLDGFWGFLAPGMWCV